MLNIKEIKSVWEFCHILKDREALSGCLYDETITFLKVKEFIQPEIKVLEIGVGLGYVTEGFSKICDISALDISAKALARIISYCEKVYTVEYMERLPVDYFDLIICHNGVQHIPTDLLKEEFKYVIASLKDTGVLAMEFVSSNLVEDNGDIIVRNNIGTYCRTPMFMEKLINEIGGVCEMVVNNSCSKGMVTGCHVFHVRKK